MLTGFPASAAADPLGRFFARWRSDGRRALVPYLTAGYPAAGHTVPLLERLADAGADVLELGVPFSDPVADGPTIQRASQRALAQGVTLAVTLELLREFRRSRTTPVVLFSYLNPVLAYGAERFIEDAVGAGAQGVLLTDLPLGGDEDLEGRLEEAPLSLVRLVAPTTTPERASRIAARAQGFLYFIARTGVTGATARLREDLGAEVAVLRAAAGVPVAVGFGISTPDQAAAVAGVADGVVVGSALIDALDRDGEDAAGALILSFRRAMDGSAPG